MRRPSPKRRAAHRKTKVSLLLALPTKSNSPVEAFDQMSFFHPLHPRQGVPCTQASLLLVMTATKPQRQVRVWVMPRQDTSSGFATRRHEGSTFEPYSPSPDRSGRIPGILLVYGQRPFSYQTTQQPSHVARLWNNMGCRTRPAQW